MSQNLEELDGKPITGTERQFLLQLHIRKLKREQAAERREAKLAAAAEAHRQAQVGRPFRVTDCRLIDGPCHRHGPGSDERSLTHHQAPLISNRATLSRLCDIEIVIGPSHT